MQDQQELDDTLDDLDDRGTIKMGEDSTVCSVRLGINYEDLSKTPDDVVRAEECLRGLNETRKGIQFHFEDDHPQ